MAMWWLITFSSLGGLAVLFLLGRRNEKAVRRDWELLLTPRGEKLYKSISGRVQTQLELADMTYDEAFSVHQLGSVEEAKHLLDVGFRVIEKFAPSMLQLLAAMATFSRMVSAMTPVRPLRPQSFRLPQIVSLAYLNQVVHQFLVSTSERFRLRLYVLGRGFGLATRFLLASTRKIGSDAPDQDREWDQIQAIRDDFQTLTSESMESLRVLLTSLATQDRDSLLERL
jgi:hypothetical protein